jgi:hypothetical protein
MSGELIKLRIKAFRDEQFSEEISNGEFKSLLNPEKYTFRYKIDLNNDQASGTSSSAPRFSKVPPEDLELDFVFDRTGVIVDYGSPAASEDDKVFKDEGSGIIDDIETFQRVVFDYNGDEHRPNYLIISWGTLLFKGTLSEMNIIYKLFKSDGLPLRATVHAKFKGFVEDNLRVAMENNSSPDLTHVRIVNQGDTLPLMTHRIYGDSKYYLEVARVNQITNFRKLKVGQQIYFPPIEK